MSFLLYTNVISEWVEPQPDPRMAAWLAEEVPARFEGRILPIDRRIAETWGFLTAHGRKAGATLGSIDTFFAATAEAHAITLVTRNIQDFESLGIPLSTPGSRGNQFDLTPALRYTKSLVYFSVFPS